MTPNDPEFANRLQDIFADAAERQPAERASFLEAACGGDAKLRAEVEALLAADEEVSQYRFLGEPTLTADPVNQAGDDLHPHSSRHKPATFGEDVGSVIDGYKLLELIGEGGWGQVFMAEQNEPIRRKVALKLLKPGVDSPQVLRRFEAERQALAMMDHPNIAKVLDAGQTASNRPYFVMELVYGVPITEYCDAHHMNLRQRLELFMDVCGAVQHAHYQGIIHRDIKPSNVMVADYDGKPVVKVIDFGVAKAIRQPLTEDTLFTPFGGIMGTLQYLSPEQATLNALNVDTRSDVYSLGVLLYELLTGSTPLTGDRVRQTAFDAVLRIIREEDPPTPSIRLGQSRASLVAIAAARGEEPTRLGCLVRGELDWILAKALDRERVGRYPSALAFAVDIGHHLAGEPVDAARPTAVYRLRKFLRRHRVPALAGSLVVLALVGGLWGAGWGLVYARRALLAESRQRQRAEHETAEKETAKLAAEGNERKAIAAAEAAENAKKKEATQREQAETVAFVLESVFRRLNPRFAQPGTADFKSQLLAGFDEVWTNVKAQYVADSVVRVRLQNTLGVTQMALGENAKAEKLLREALKDAEAHFGPDDWYVILTRQNLAGALLSNGKTTESIKYFEQVLASEKRTLSPADPLIGIALGNLALAYRTNGRCDNATIKLQEQAVELLSHTVGEQNPDTLAAINNLALAWVAAGRTDRAIEEFERLHQLADRAPGEDHPDRLLYVNNLAAAYLKADRAGKALEAIRPVFDRLSTRLGADHPYVIMAMGTLGSACVGSGRLQEGLDLLKRAVERQRSKFGPDHPNSIAGMDALGWAYVFAGMGDDAIPLLEEAYDRRSHTLGPDHADTLASGYHLAGAYLLKSRNESAIKLMVDVCGRQQKAAALNQVDDLFRSQTLAVLSILMLKTERFAEAEPVMRECLAIRQRKEPHQWTTFSAQALLGGSLLGQKNYAAAEPLLRAGYEGMIRREQSMPPAAKPRLAECAERLATLYEATGRRELAEKYRLKRGESAATRPTTTPAE